MRQFFKYLLATVVGLFVFFFLLFVFFAGIAGMASKSDVTKTGSNAVLQLNFDTPMPDRGNEKELNIDFFGGVQPNLGLNDVIANIRKATEDEDIKGIYLDLSIVSIGVNMLEDIREELIAFKKAGKFIVSYGEIWDQKAYYLASLADETYLNPEGLIFVKGYSAEITFYKGLMDKLGVEPQIFYAGKFKSATEPYRLTSMSEANKTQYRTLLSDFYDSYVAHVAENRAMSAASVDDIIDGYKVRGPKTAKEFNFVDDLLYEDEVNEVIREKIGLDADKKINFITLSKYNKVKGNKKGSIKNRIAVVYADGGINIGEGAGGNESVGADTYVEALRKIGKDKKVKAVVMRVNSPGGSALASDMIWHEVENLKKKGIPVITSMGNVAASGGYYIACNSDSILAGENTITGSIGVFLLGANMEKLFKENLGMTFDTVKTSNLSDFPLAPLTNRSLTEMEKQIFQKQTDEMYATFLSRVAEGRGMQVDAVNEIAQGRVWTGQDALDIGLVDRMGDLNDAIAVAAGMANLEEGDYRLKSYPQQKDPIQKLVEDLMGNVRQDAIEAELGTYYQHYKQLKEINGMQGVQARMPYEMEIK